MGSIKQEGRKLIQGCVVELVTSASSWNSTYWGPSEECVEDNSEFLPKTQHRKACYHLLLAHIDQDLSQVSERTGLAEFH